MSMFLIYRLGNYRYYSKTPSSFWMFIGSNFTLSHYDDEYPTIDHKISIYEGFCKGMEPELISSIQNICWTKRTINIKKNKKSFYSENI